MLVVCGDCRIPRGSKRGEKGPRVWHQSVTETETECGNFTSLYREEKPSELCTEVTSMQGINPRYKIIIIIISVCLGMQLRYMYSKVNNTLCVCSTRNTVTRDGETQVEEDAEWLFKCGTCELKLV